MQWLLTYVSLYSDMMLLVNLLVVGDVEEEEEEDGAERLDCANDQPPQLAQIKRIECFRYKRTRQDHQQFYVR